MDMEEDITDRIRRQAIMSPRMPELQPIEPRSAEELTPGELHSLDEIGLSPALSRSGPYEQMVKYGAQPRLGYYGSRYAGDDFQSEYGYNKKEFVTNGAQRSGRSQESFRSAREENFGLQRHTEKAAAGNVKFSGQAGDSADHYVELPNGGKSDRKLFGDGRYRNQKQLDEFEYETVDEWSGDESDIRALQGCSAPACEVSGCRSGLASRLCRVQA
jgi:hypothetical protein